MILHSNAIKTAVIVLLTASFCYSQTDPGPRKGAAGAGGYYPTLNSGEQFMFNQALLRFEEVDSVTGTIESGSGLGPGYNANSCAACHAQPSTGGSGPGLTSPQNPVPNPQVALATLHGAKNSVPAFITANGPVRAARFVSDGGVHDLYTIAGRVDAPGCTLAQPDFAQAAQTGNLVFRIPTPLYGLGLVEATPDTVLQANLAANASAKSQLGIAGHFNLSGNDGTIMRFGWKAQNKSLLMFAGEAYNVEQGVSNELFPNERNAVTGCVFNQSPEDSTNISLNSNASATSSDVVNFAMFIRMSAPPVSTTASSSELNGEALFTSTGCVLCHSSSLTTGPSIFTGMSNVAYHPYSDFALHNMGAALADGIAQGNAAGAEFRTAPLWGLGQRLFFLHDGRASDLLTAIQAHTCAAAPPAQGPPPPGCTSEASKVIGQFNALSASQKQDLLNFLRSL
jgi:CxxC motif-containing protein (DUF1111 family)